MVLLENVKGLVVRRRTTLDNIVAQLESEGYFVSWRLLESHTHGAVPQK